MLDPPAPQSQSCMWFRAVATARLVLAMQYFFQLGERRCPQIAKTATCSSRPSRGFHRVQSQTRKRQNDLIKPNKKHNFALR